MGAEMRFTDVGGHRTRSVVAGQGGPVILLHGITGHAETWIRNIVSLSAHHQVDAMDVLGHGLTAKPYISYSIASIGTHVLSYMDAGVAPSAIIIRP